MFQQLSQILPVETSQGDVRMLWAAQQKKKKMAEKRHPSSEKSAFAQSATRGNNNNNNNKQQRQQQQARRTAATTCTGRGLTSPMMNWWGSNVVVLPKQGSATCASVVRFSVFRVSFCSVRLPVVSAPFLKRSVCVKSQFAQNGLFFHPQPHWPAAASLSLSLCFRFIAQYADLIPFVPRVRSVGEVWAYSFDILG